MVICTADSMLHLFNFIIDLKRDLLLSCFLFYLAAILQFYEQKRSRTKSTILLVFYLVNTLVQFTTFQILFDPFNKTFVMNAEALIAGLPAVTSLLMFVLESLSRNKNYYVSLDEDLNITPELNAGLFARLSFSWY